MTIPVYINNFNWLTTTRAMAEWFASIPGIEPIIVDNASTYRPLLDWYANKNECPYKVIFLNGNHGHHAPWNLSAVLWSHTHRAMFGSDYYAVTDPDLSFEGVPKDLFDVCLAGFDLLPNVVKVGIGLKIDDIPPHARGRVHHYEQRYWTIPITERYFAAPIDTTFAVYDAQVRHQIAMSLDVPTLRTNAPYLARHLPWYWKQDTYTDEQQHFYSTRGSSSTWTPSE